MGRMAIDSVLSQALVDLAGVRHTRIDAHHGVPKLAGLYAFYGDEQAWSDLDLSPAFDDWRVAPVGTGSPRSWYRGSG